jgi:hypothetical protein
MEERQGHLLLLLLPIQYRQDPGSLAQLEKLRNDIVFACFEQRLRRRGVPRLFD